MHYHKIYLAYRFSTNEKTTIINRKSKKPNSLNVSMANSIWSALSFVLQFALDIYSVWGGGTYYLY